MNSRELTNDRLGAKGEARFKELCEDAGLIANKAGRDMMGWDYIVESPLEGGNGLPIDKRPQGAVCRVQIKTIWAREDGRVSLSLSACELLAKTVDPALICTFVVNDDLEFLSASMIHIIDDKLARVLKRLRTASTEIDGKGLNEREITFSAEDAGESFKLTGADLRRRLSEICGSNAKAYREKKERQLDELGYDERGWRELKTTLRVSNHDEMVDFFLGKKPIELVDAQSFDKRFGMSVPTDEISIKEGARATIQLFPPDKIECRIRVRPAETKGSPAVFKGFVDAVPRTVPDEHQKMVFRTALFRIELSGKGAIEFSTMGEAINSSEMDLRGWSNAFRLLRYVGQGSILVEVSGTSSNSPQDEFRIKTSASQELEDDAAYLENIVAMASWLLGEAGVSELVLTRDEIEIAAPSIEMAYIQMATGRDETFSFTSQLVDDSPPARQTMILMGRLMIGRANLCFATKLGFSPTITGSQILWSETDAEPIRVREFDGTDEGFAKIGSSIMSQTRADGMMTIQIQDSVEE